jgi:hypothetical protein
MEILVGNTTGEVALTGDDTSVVGTTHDTGYIASSPKDAAQPDYIRRKRAVCLALAV